MRTQLTKLGNGVEGLFVEDSRFKTTLVSFSFFLPLSEKEAAQYALLPFLLTTSCEEYPSFRELNLRLSELYGAKLSASVLKVGDCQQLKIAVSCINDSFALNCESVVAEATELLVSMVFAPSLCGESFKKSDVEREKRLMRERIFGEINEKRLYARKQLISTMFRGNAYATERYGSVEALNETTPQSLFAAWERMLRSAFVRVQVFSDKYPKAIFSGIEKAFSAINRDHITDVTSVRKYTPSEYIDTEENMDIAQGKLVMGFSVDMCGSTRETLPLTVMTDLFGGGPYSKLFTNVREKLSLCYYCASAANRQKGYLLVDSGVEANNAEKAKDAILKELEEIKNGNFSAADLEYSKAGIKDSLKSSLDSQGALDNYFSVRVSEEEITPPDALVDEIDSVTSEDVIAVANGIKLTTVYRLMPKREVQ